MDRYRDRRSPDRERPRYPAPDSYIPPTSIRASRARSRSAGRYRARSRSQPRRNADVWRSQRPRSRTPPRRFDDRHDAYQSREYRDRSPRRDYYPSEKHFDSGPRAGRDRSPPSPLKRGREGSPGGRGGRSSPPVKRERMDDSARDYPRPPSPFHRGYGSPLPGPKNDYRARSRSPIRRDGRDERGDPHGPRRYRSPSPRPVRHGYKSGEGSGRNSVTTSRRSSPRHYERNPVPYKGDNYGPATTSQRAPVSGRTPPATSSLPPARAQSPIRDDSGGYDIHPQPASVNEYRQSSEAYADVRDERAPPTGPSFKDPRAPPTGPSNAARNTSNTAISPTPPASTAVSISAHNRDSSTGIPTQPRGASYRGRGGSGPVRDYHSRDYTPTGPSGRGGRGGWNNNGGYQRAPPPPSRESNPSQEGGQVYDARRRPPPPPPYQSRDSMHGPPGFRGSSNSTSTTYPRSLRFDANGAPLATSATDAYLADLPAIKPGGERLPPLHDMTKADRLEEEAARIRKSIDEKEAKKRAGLREWDRMERESKTAQLRTELAEEALRKVSGEADGLGVGGVAAF